MKFGEEGLKGRSSFYCGRKQEVRMIMVSRGERKGKIYEWCQRQRREQRKNGEEV